MKTKSLVTGVIAAVGVLAMLACNGGASDPAGGANSDLTADDNADAGDDAGSCGEGERLITRRFSTLSACVSSRPFRCSCDCLSQGSTVLLSCCCPDSAIP